MTRPGSARCQQFRFAVMGSLNVASALPDISVFFGQDTIHRPGRAQVASKVEQSGIYLLWGFILKTFAVKLIEHHLLLRWAQRQGRSRPFHFRLGCGVELSIKGGPGDLQRLAGSLFTDIAAQCIGGLNHLLPSMFSRFCSMPKISEIFFWASIMIRACLSLCCRRRFSRSSSVTRLSRGFFGFALRPRFAGARPLRMPLSRCLRQHVRCDEYSPFFRSRAPICPGSVHWSACWRTRSL